MMLLFWLLIGFGIYYFISRNETGKFNIKNGTSPEDILKERYVNGELDEVTYERMRTTLKR